MTLDHLRKIALIQIRQAQRTDAMNTINLNDHPSNLDKSAVLVRSWQRGHGLGAVYKVRAGYVGTFDLKTHEGHKATEDEARAWVDAQH